MANKIGRYFDTAVGTLFPGWGFKRSLNRVRMETMQEQSRHYEGAADGRRASSWISTGTLSANLEIAKDLVNLVRRARELAINNPYAKKAPYVIANNIVGTGILATINIPDTVEKGKVVKAKNKAQLQKAFAQAWKEWAEDVSADYDGNFNFYGLQHLAIRTKSISGEILAIRKRVGIDVNKYGFQVLLIEADFIDTTKDTTKDTDGGFTFRGIKYDKNFKRSGYWLYDRHPSEGNAKSTLFPIADVIHLYEVERPAQNRGVPDSASTMLTQRDFADYMDAELLAKKGAACFAGVVQKAELPETDTTQDQQQLESLEPGMFHYLNPGETINFPSLPQNPGLSEFVKVQLRAVAAGYLMPYENLTGDLSNVNYSSGRMGQMEFKKQVEHWQHNTFIPKFCDGVFKWFVEGAKIAFMLPKETDVNVKANWTAPRWTMIDPTKEIAAMLAETRAGFSTWSEKVRENGLDPDAVLEEMENDQKLFIEAGLMPNWTQYFELQAKVNMNKGKTGDPQQP